MTVVNRAVLKFSDGRETPLALFKVEDRVYRWIVEAGGKLLDGIDFLDSTTAIKHLRVTVETGVEFVGCDLTFIPVALPPEERAAKRITALIDAEYGCQGDEPVARIIREETQIDQLLEHVNLLLVYRIQRSRLPKPAGLDLAEGGLLLNVIEVLEKVQKVDLGNLKRNLTTDINSVKVFSSVPPVSGGKPS